MRKRIVIDIRHAVANHYIRQPATTFERTGPYVRHTVGYRHVRQPSTARKHMNPDARHAVANRHARQPAATAERLISHLLMMGAASHC